MRLDDEHQDAVREITNVAMGQAGAALARTLDTFVQMSIPKVHVLRADRLIDAVAPASWANRRVTVIREAFFGVLKGEALILLDVRESHADAHAMLGDGAQLSPREFSLEIANMLIGACLDSIAAQLGYDVGYSPPQVMGEATSAAESLAATKPDTDVDLLAIAFDLSVDASLFMSRVVLVLASDAALHFTAAIDRFLAKVSE
jgi:chemotaxis protein CheC